MGQMEQVSPYEVDFYQAEVELDQVESFELETEVKIDSLTEIHGELTKCQGINRDLAVAVESIEEGIIKTRYPLASFSPILSKTNYTVTMEAISDNIATAIKDIIDAVVKVIRSITRWFVDAFKALYHRFNSTQRAAEKNAETEKATIRLLGFLPAAEKKVAEQEIKAIHDERDVFLKEDLETMHNDLVTDIIKKGPVYTAYSTFGAHFVAYMEALDARLDVYGALLRRSMTDKLDDGKLQSDIDAELSSNRISTPDFYAAMRKVMGDADDAIGTSHLLRILKERAFSLVSSSNSPVPTYDAIERSQITEEVIAHAEKVPGLNQRLSKRGESLTFHARTNEHRSGIIRGLNEIGRLVRGDLRGIAAYTTTASYFATAGMAAVRMQAKLSQSKFNNTYKHARKASPGPTQELVDRLRAAFAKHNEA